MEHTINRTLTVLGAGALLFVSGCCHQHAAVPVPAPIPVPVMVTPAPAPVPAPVATEAKAEEAKAPAKEPDFKTPESMLWDPDADVYLVSNIQGKPGDLDKNGFISKVSPDGKILELKWIDGTKKGADLSAPKGMALVGDTLYVADINTVRKFDRKTGKPKGKIAILASVFLNDLSLSPDGKSLYVSDSALKVDAKGITGTGDDAIFVIDVKNGSWKPLIKNKDLKGPNGLLADTDGVWVVTMLANELYHVNTKGVKGPSTMLPKGGLDGIVKLPDGSLLISSWEAQAIFRGLPGVEFKEFLTNAPSPADIGFDSNRSNVLIPNFGGSAIDIRHLPELTPIAPAPTPTK